MASVWIRTRKTKAGARRHRVEYRPGGREEGVRFAGSFRTEREAKIRRRFVENELAAGRIPDLSLSSPQKAAETLTEAAGRWRESRIDVTESTRVLHRVALNRVTKVLGARHVDEVTEADVVELVTTLADGGSKRETIRKSVKYLAAVLDECNLEGPNPARSKSIRLPHEEHEELNPPMASHVQAVYERVDDVYKLPLLLLDWSGARVSSIYEARVGDYDRISRRVRLRASTTKTRKALWIELPAEFATAIERTLGDVDAPIFEGNANALRTAIARACRDAGVPVFSPHDLRHRRISLLHHQGRSWAEIARFVGQRKLSLTADTYTHVLSDGRELDYCEMLG